MGRIQDKTLQLLTDSAVNYGITALFVLFLVWASLKLRSWYQDDSDPAADLSELLIQFKDLHRQGQISEEEFRSIKGHLIDHRADPSGEDLETTDAE